MPTTTFYEEPPASTTSLGYYAYEEPVMQDQWNAGASVSNLSVNNEGKVSLDLPTLMFIAGQGGMARSRPAYPPRPYAAAPAQPKGPCYHCNGDHWARECPKKDMVRVNGYCAECGLTHLIGDCPNNPDKKPKATLNVLSTIPSSSSKEEPKVEVKVVTRAQRKRAKGQSRKKRAILNT